MGSTVIVPLGGLGEIGLNTLALEAGDDLIVVDCGLLFPQPQHPGVDYLIPDFSYLRERHSRIRAVFLTHGHEDHVGALGHFLREFPVPVYGARLTLGLAETRLREMALSARHLFRPVALGDRVEAGPFRVEFLRVTHSTAEAAALALETPGGTLLHTGDFKFDPTPVDGKPTDEEGLARWGRRGVDLLSCDSTNAGTPGSAPSERQVGLTLRRLFPTVEGRVYVATFASNVHRVQQVIEASREVGRAVVPLGRCMTSTVRVARRLGLLRPAPGDLIPATRAQGLPRESVTWVVTGSQGEVGSALYRVVQGVDPRHRIGPGDHVFLSSRRIPGNEPAIHRLVNLCLRQGARVHYEEVSEVHVSGHACREEILRMLDLTRPRHVLPVHGELRHLDALARLAVDWGLPAQAVFLVENGQSVLLENGSLRMGPSFRTGRVFVDSGEEGSSEDGVLGDRRRLAEEGFAMAIAAVGKNRSRLLRGPEVILRGVFPEGISEEAAKEAQGAIHRHLSRRGPAAGTGRIEIEAEMVTALRRYFRNRQGRRPLVLAQVVEVDSEEERSL